jgi:hypothetical protein
MKADTQTIHLTATHGSATIQPPIVLKALTSKSPVLRRSLLLGLLLGLIPTLQASEWGFRLIGKPSVELTEILGETDDSEEQHPTEVFQMTGAGQFNPEKGTASGQGSFAFINAFDEDDVPIGGPTFRGTWKVTKFVSWTEAEGLQVIVTLFYKVGLNEASKGFEAPALITISRDGINYDDGFELFSSNTIGSATFNLKKP